MPDFQKVLAAVRIYDKAILSKVLWNTRTMQVLCRYSYSTPSISEQVHFHQTWLSRVLSINDSVLVENIRSTQLNKDDAVYFLVEYCSIRQPLSLAFNANLNRTLQSSRMLHCWNGLHMSDSISLLASITSTALMSQCHFNCDPQRCCDVCLLHIRTTSRNIAQVLIIRYANAGTPCPNRGIRPIEVLSTDRMPSRC